MGRFGRLVQLLLLFLIQIHFHESRTIQKQNTVIRLKIPLESMFEQEIENLIPPSKTNNKVPGAVMLSLPSKKKIMIDLSGKRTMCPIRPKLRRTINIVMNLTNEHNSTANPDGKISTDSKSTIENGINGPRINDRSVSKSPNSNSVIDVALFMDDAKANDPIVSSISTNTSIKNEPDTAAKGQVDPLKQTDGSEKADTSKEGDTSKQTEAPNQADASKQTDTSKQAEASKQADASKQVAPENPSAPKDSTPTDQSPSGDTGSKPKDQTAPTAADAASPKAQTTSPDTSSENPNNPKSPQAQTGEEIPSKDPVKPSESPNDSATRVSPANTPENSPASPSSPGTSGSPTAPNGDTGSKETPAAGNNNSSPAPDTPISPNSSNQATADATASNLSVNDKTNNGGDSINLTQATANSVISNTNNP